jgi:hypothetical protein
MDSQKLVRKLAFNMAPRPPIQPTDTLTLHFSFHAGTKFDAQFNTIKPCRCVLPGTA